MGVEMPHQNPLIEDRAPNFNIAKHNSQTELMSIKIFSWN